MSDPENSTAVMTTPLEAMKQERVMWGCALLVGPVTFCPTSLTA